jgi:hypothetical protein
MFMGMVCVSIKLGEAKKNGTQPDLQDLYQSGGLPALARLCCFPAGLRRVAHRSARLGHVAPINSLGSDRRLFAIVAVA